MSAVQHGAKIIHWMPNTDLRNNHHGLADLAKKQLKVDVGDLKVGECVMFVNAAFTAFKIYCPNNFVLHYKHPEGHKLNARAVLQVPHFMRGSEVGYKDSLRAVVERYIDAEYKSLTS